MRRLITHGFVLAVGMMLFAAITLAAFQFGGLVVLVAWMIALFAAGVFFRRTLWRNWGFASLVVGIAIGFTFPAIALLGLIGDRLVSLRDVLVGAWQLLGSYYLPFYWLPFVLGLLVGGIRGKNRQAEQAVVGNPATRSESDFHRDHNLQPTVNARLP